MSLIWLKALRNSFWVIPVKTGIQEVFEITGYTLKDTMAGLRRYDKIDAWLSYARFHVYLFENPPSVSGWAAVSLSSINDSLW